MNKQLLSIVLLAHSYSVITADLSQDCALPTPYILQYLRISSTLFKGSDEWKNQIQDDFAGRVTGGVRADTVFARTHDTSNGTVNVYGGIPARLYYLTHGAPGFHLSANILAASGNHTMNNNGDTVTITSNIKDTEQRKAQTADEAVRLRDMAFTHDGKKTTERDEHTTCNHVRQLFFKDDSRTLESTIVSSCRTTLPIAEFIAALKKS